MADLTGQFIELFQGNRDAIGLEEGGCLRLEYPDPWQHEIEDHLTGQGPPIGVYPMVARYDVRYGAFWGVYWGCIDFDEGEEESWPHAVNVRAVLEQFGITAWIERSRSKGFHVWVFADSWVPARTMRRALLAACQLVGAPTREINPKQEELSEGQLGNYVRLPYPGWLSSHQEVPATVDQHRRVVVTDRPGLRSFITLTLGQFVSRALANRTQEGQLEKVADYLKKPKRPAVSRAQTGAERYVNATTSMEKLGGLAYTILTQGPQDGVDRSTTLWKLATRIHDDGTHTFEEALDIMVQADLAWGKFMDRPNGEAELTRMLEKIWQ